MDSLGFFIDTGGKEDISPVDEEETVEALVEDEVMGAKDAQTEAKQRNRARTERSHISVW
jgi:ribosomal protein L19E